MKKKLYLANPYGFSKQTKKLLYEFINIFNDLKKCDCIFAIVNGTPPDEGVMIELGIAIAMRKEIFLFRDDFRNCSDSNQYPLNLMLFLGLPRDNWKKYYFETLEDIKSNKKGLVEWAKK